MIAELLAALVGAAFGSFLNVVIYRVPREESVAFPGSHCPACAHPLHVTGNIPVLSWVLLRGLFRDCQAGLSARCPPVELMTAALFVLAVLEFGISLETLAAALLSAFLVVTVF